MSRKWTGEVAIRPQNIFLQLKASFKHPLSVKCPWKSPGISINTMICLVFPYSGIILNLSHIHIGYILHKDFCLYPSFLLVPMHTRLYAQLTWIHPGCLEACLCPTIYPWRMILGICQCITQKNSLKFLPYPSISPSFKQLLKKKKQKKLISLISREAG